MSTLGNNYHIHPVFSFDVPILTGIELDLLSCSNNLIILSTYHRIAAICSFRKVSFIGCCYHFQPNCYGDQTRCAGIQIFAIDTKHALLGALQLYVHMT